MADNLNLELKKRKNIFDTQILFNNFLNKELINELMNLFDESSNNFTNKNEKISNYIKE